MESECDDLKYIDDVPFSQYFAKFLDNFNRDQRKKNTQAIVDFIEQMKDSLEKGDDISSTYAFMSNSSNLNLFQNAQKQGSRETTIENLIINVNKRLSASKKKFLNILCISPNLDALSLELVNKEVITFMGNFFGRKDLGIKY
jgi:hypothetical protein